jgi:hypothetical protein
LRRAARRFGVALRTVQRWVQRTAGQRLDRVDWTNRSSQPRRTRRLAADVEDRVLEVRRDLQLHSDLGEFGARAIHEHLREQGDAVLPAIRTIGRILARHGVLDGRRRTRRPPPPPGWYLPDLARHAVELDAFDVVEGLLLPDGEEVQVLTAISLYGRLVQAWPHTSILATTALEALREHWRAVGLPAYAQFDNDTRFQGPHNQPDTLGRVIRLCLSLGVVPVFAPPRETGFQAAIESFNGLWQAKVWQRCAPGSLAALQERSARYVRASHKRHAARNDTAPARRAFPRRWRLDLQAAPRGRVVFLRRTTDQGTVDVLGHRWTVDAHWTRRLVRAEVELDRGRIRFYALRRREPEAQPLLSEQTYRLPQRPFREASWRETD